MKKIVRKSLSLILALTLCCSLPFSVLADSDAIPEPAAEPTVKEIKIDFSGENVPSVDVTVAPGEKGTGSVDASEVVDEAIEDELKDIRNEMIEENGKARPVFDEKGNVIGFESTTVEFDEEGKRVTTIEQTTVNADTADRKVSASMSDVTNNGSGDPGDWDMQGDAPTDTWTGVVDTETDLRTMPSGNEYEYNEDYHGVPDWDKHAFMYYKTSIGSRICIDLVGTDGMPFEGPGLYEIQNKNGDKFYAYCADINTLAVPGESFDMINVEDASYYSDEDAGHIRFAALNGYWGIDSTEKDENGNVIPAAGSLEAVQALMAEAKNADGSAMFTPEEIASLTEGQALVATQAAIWYYANSSEESYGINSESIIGSGAAFNGYYYGNIKYSEETDLVKDFEVRKQNSNPDKYKDYQMAGFQENEAGYVPENERETVQKLFELLKSGTEKATDDTIAITTNNAFTSTTITVNNQVATDIRNLNTETPDNYNVDVAFTLGVVPGKKDTLKVEVYQMDAEGEVVMKDGKPVVLKTVEVETGKTDYVVNGLELPNGSTISLNLSGINNLEEGVYLYSAVNYRTTQTMVGIASGDQAVDFSVNLSFEVDDPVLHREKTVRTSVEVKPNIPRNDPPEVIPDEPTPLDPQPTPNDPVEILDEDVPMDDLVEIEEEEIPLAAVPQTGDNSAIFTVLSVLSGTGLAGLALTKKKNGK